MQSVIFTAPAQIIQIFLRGLGFGCDRYITFCLRVGDLDFIGQQILGKEPGGQDFLRVPFVEDTDGRTLGDHLRMIRIKLGHRPYCCLELDQFVFRDVRQRRVRTHPGGTRCRVNGKNTLSRVHKVGRIA